MTQSGVIQSLVRGLRVLQEVARSEDGLTAKEIGESLNLSRPTAHNLATTLLSERFLMKCAKPTRYALGPAAGELLHTAAENHRRSLARRLIVELVAQDSGAGYIYAEAGDDEMRLVWRVDFTHPGVIEMPDREVNHPYDTAAALIFHAFAAAPRAEALRRRYRFEDFGRSIWNKRRDFDAFLNEIREEGGVFRPWASQRELRAAAAPVFDRSGTTLVGTLGAFWPQGLDKARGNALMAAIRQDAETLSNQ
jgi:DNA-binding IclR family transcriptional regulator